MFSSLHVLREIRHLLKMSFPSITVTISNKVIFLASFPNEKPPFGPLEEVSSLFRARICSIFARKGAGIERSAEIFFIPVFVEFPALIARYIIARMAYLLVFESI